MPLDLGASSPGLDHSSAELVRRARDGDHEAFAVLVTRHESMVMRTALALLGHVDLAQDAAQEAFLRFFRYLRRFDETRELGPWLYRLVVNVCHDLGRRRSRHRFVPLEESGEVEAPASREAVESGIARAEARALVRQAILTLPEKERAALVLRDIEGQSTADVARILGSSEGTVRSQVARARLKIRAHVSKARSTAPAPTSNGKR